MGKHELKNKQNASSSERDDSAGKELDWIAERRERLNVATQETRFDIVQNIIAHPQQLPSLRELDYFMEGVRKSTIRNHLDKLQDAAVVARVELPEDMRKRDLPHVFYGLTDTAYEDLKAVGLVENERLLQEATLRTDVSSGIEEYMSAPRPQWDPASEFDPADGDDGDVEKVDLESS